MGFREVRFLQKQTKQTKQNRIKLKKNKNL